ncbi:MAG TPA: L-rhamnose isomerase [Spirochaetia bacterium]|nr:L-rhamnose isomerase [Spirochaetia bacterium]
MPTPPATDISARFESARKTYAAWGVDVERALQALARIPLSLHCWQADDVGGFENSAGLSGGGIQTTGNYPGKARTADEMRADYEKAFSLIPGPHKANLHAIYAETGGRKVERDALAPEHFSAWMSWAKKLGIGLDFNQTYFSHPLAESGFTLSSADAKVRDFWVRHSQRCRQIGEAMGRATGVPCIVNLWIQDGAKEVPADRLAPRQRLVESLDRVFETRYDPRYLKDAIEGKLFGIGSESYVVGSHEFYLAYALRHELILTLDMGHYHPTESVADKIPALLPFVRELLLHVSRGVRWDSDHVVILGDEVKAVASEIARAQAWDRVHVATDYFDASINRVAAWVTGARATRKAMLLALLEPTEILRREEAAGNLTRRLGLLEEIKDLPFGAVWDRFCEQQGVPAGAGWLDQIADYERSVLSTRR